MPILRPRPAVTARRQSGTKRARARAASWARFDDEQLLAMRFCDLKLKLDYATKEAGAYPILLVTYELVCSKGKDAEKQKAIKAFLKHFASADVQKSLEEIGYAPLPKAMEDKVLTAIDAIS